jgi:hypothetical protein
MLPNRQAWVYVSPTILVSRLLVLVSDLAYIAYRERKRALRRALDLLQLLLEADLRLVSVTSIWAIPTLTLKDAPIALDGTIKRGSTRAFVLPLAP